METYYFAIEKQAYCISECLKGAQKTCDSLSTCKLNKKVVIKWEIVDL